MLSPPTGQVAVKYETLPIEPKFILREMGFQRVSYLECNLAQINLLASVSVGICR